MSIEDIRKRYQPPAGNLAEEVKKLRVTVADRDRDILTLLGEIDRLNTGKPPGPDIVPGEEEAAIAEQLKEAGLPEDYVPRGPVTQPREAENVQQNAVRTTQSGIPLETHAFDEPYRGRR